MLGVKFAMLFVKFSVRGRSQHQSVFWRVFCCANACIDYYVCIRPLCVCVCVRVCERECVCARNEIPSVAARKTLGAQALFLAHWRWATF